MRGAQFAGLVFTVLAAAQSCGGAEVEPDGDEPDGDEPMACVPLPEPRGWPSNGEVEDRVDTRSENPECNAEGQYIGVRQDSDGQLIYTIVTETPWRDCQIGARWESTQWAGGCES